MEKVSIITISYNSAETIEDTLQSVLEQSYGNIEYIIIDGKSTDRTMEVVRKYEDRIAVICSEPDKGLYDAMNKGIQQATGDIVGILNSDDLYVDNKVVEDMVVAMRGFDSGYADLVYVDRVDTDLVTRRWTSGNFRAEKFKYGWTPPHPTFFLRKACYNKFGVYNLDLRHSADYELMLRMLFKHRLSASYLNRITTKMRVGGQSNVTLKNRLAANREDRLAWKINGLIPAFYTLTLKPVRKIGQFFIR